MVWISLTVLRLERAEQQARAQAALEENTRLALWRLDSALMPLLAQEAARPSAPFQADPGTVPARARETPPEVLLHFQIAPGGEVTSPQERPGRLEALRIALRGTDVAARLPRQPPAPPPNAAVAPNDQGP